MSYTEEEQDFINEHERKRYEESKKYELNIQLVIESLEPLIRHNREYLKYRILQKDFEMSKEEQKKTALHNALTEVIGRAIKYSISEAREIAFKTLEGVNDHQTAEAFAKLLGQDVEKI